MTPNLSLSKAWPEPLLKEAVMTRAAWKPYPAAADRAGWDALPVVLKQDLLRQARETAQLPWPAVPASVYLQFQQNGNRSQYEALYFERRRILAALVLGECAECKGRWLSAILDAAWSICEESSWCLPAHLGMQASRGGAAGHQRAGCGPVRGRNRSPVGLGRVSARAGAG